MGDRRHNQSANVLDRSKAHDVTVALSGGWNGAVEYLGETVGLAAEVARVKPKVLGP